jgi:hypothetical protein
MVHTDLNHSLLKKVSECETSDKIRMLLYIRATETDRRNTIPTEQSSFSLSGRRDQSGGGQMLP